MSLLENIVLVAPPLAAQSLVASPLAASDMHWEWVATNSQRILELTLSHLYQASCPSHWRSRRAAGRLLREPSP